jgi:hypothetical protein
MSCSVVMLFICTLVRSHPNSRKTLGVKPDRDKQQDTGLGIATRCMLREGGQKETQSKPGTRQRRTYSIREVLQEDGCSSMYSNYVCSFMCNIICFHNMPCNSSRLGKLIHNIDWCLFFAG